MAPSFLGMSSALRFPAVAPGLTGRPSGPCFFVRAVPHSHSFGLSRNRAHTHMLTGHGGPPHGCLRAFGKTGQQKLTGRKSVYATSTDNANASTGPVIPRC